jgi:hypothetical protein
MPKHHIFATKFAGVYPLNVQKGLVRSYLCCREITVSSGRLRHGGTIGSRLSGYELTSSRAICTASALQISAPALASRGNCWSALLHVQRLVKRQLGLSLPALVSTSSAPSIAASSSHSQAQDNALA